jgi:hypothetical protein|nr:hypothetical protein [Kofleriaceae bacterium]
MTWPRKLALWLCGATSALIAVMLVISVATGATQEAHEYTVAPADYAASLLAAPAATRLLFGVDVAFLILYTVLFVALAAHLARRGAPRPLLYLAVGTICVVAMIDAVEDHHILSLLDLAEHGGLPSDGAMTFQQTLSATKFSLSTLALVCFGLAIPRDRRLGSLLAGFLIVGTLATTVLSTAASPDLRAQLDHGRWIGFLVGFVLAGAWLRGEPDS